MVNKDAALGITSNRQLMMRLWYFLIAVLAIAAPYSYAQTALKISTNQSRLSQHISPLVTLAYQSINQPISITYAPSYRSLKLANQGVMDGELYRIADINKRFPNLVIVPVPLYYIKLTAYAKSDRIKIDGWRSLSAYHLGIIRGIELVNKHTISMHRTIADSHSQLFNMLQNDRIQIALSARYSAAPIIDALKYSEIKALKPSILSFPVYHFVHKKNKHLIPALTKALENLISHKTQP
jgi:polar amino acid transport system substrate-binding protein